MWASTSRASGGNAVSATSSDGDTGVRAAAVAQSSPRRKIASARRDRDDCGWLGMPRSLPAAAGALSLTVLGSRVGCAHANVQLAQLLLADRRRRVDEQILAALRFGKCDDVANRIGAAHQRNGAIEPERDAAMRWSAVLERIQQKAEFPPLIFRRNAKCSEHLLLHFRAVNAHRSAADLPTVQHDVVSFCKRLRGLDAEQSFVTVLRRGERMMARRPALPILVVFEHRKIDDPQ